MSKKRVVITGIGAITPCGNSKEEFWNAIKQGQSGIDYITQIDTTNQLCKIAGEIKNFPADLYVEKKDTRRMDLFIQYAIAASKQAYADANLTEEQIDPERFSVVIGSGSGGTGSIERLTIEAEQKGHQRVTPFFVPMTISDMAAGRVSILFNAQGPNWSVVSACATGADAIGNAFRLLQYGEADIAIAGGSEAAVSPMSVAGFASAKALSFNNANPKGASRPFDVNRDGFVMAEGSSVLVLETLEHAQKRGAKIYGELIGYGRTSDAHDIVQPHPEGRGASTAIRKSLAEAGIQPTEVDYVNAHATSTPVGDVAETKAIISVFGDHATSGKMLVSGTKSMTGHMLGAAGSTEAAISLLALQEQIIPPTINLQDQDPHIPLDVVPNTARKVSGFKVALSNSFGFGGHNASLVFRVFEG